MLVKYYFIISKVLDEGRYIGRHDKIFIVIQELVSLDISRTKPQKTQCRKLTFVKVDAPLRSKILPVAATSIIANSDDREIRMDVGNRH